MWCGTVMDQPTNQEIGAGRLSFSQEPSLPLERRWLGHGDEWKKNSGHKILKSRCGSDLKKDIGSDSPNGRMCHGFNKKDCVDGSLEIHVGNFNYRPTMMADVVVPDFVDLVMTSTYLRSTCSWFLENQIATGHIMTAGCDPHTHHAQVCLDIFPEGSPDTMIILLSWLH